jgi:hypothetical protein
MFEGIDEEALIRWAMSEEEEKTKEGEKGEEREEREQSG